MSKQSEKYICSSQQRLLRVMTALAGYEIDGIEPGALAKGLGVSPPLITRDLSNLSLAGWAEKLESGSWRLSPRLIQIASAYSNSMSRARFKLDEIDQRYTRQPR